MLWIGELVWQDEQCEQCTKDFQCTDTKQAVKIPTRCHVHKQKKKNWEEVCGMMWSLFMMKSEIEKPAEI